MPDMHLEVPAATGRDPDSDIISLRPAYRDVIRR
jgi:hypothetical protein